jgi:hypothetical protein
VDNVIGNQLAFFYYPNFDVNSKSTSPKAARF